MLKDNEYSELPSEIAEKLGYEYAQKMQKEHKKETGQYFTPHDTAIYMSKFSRKLKHESITILDPGCGTGILSCSLIENLVSNNLNLKEVDLTCYEIDTGLIKITESVFKHLKIWLSSINRDIEFHYQIIYCDFITEHKNIFDENLFSQDDVNNKKYDIIISNPPYFKLSKEDKRAKVVKEIINGQINIYAIFLHISTFLLKPKGEMIFITPRSFTSGPYFKKFRSIFFNRVLISHIHIYVSRKKVFSKDKVLQEVIIIRAINQEKNSNDKIVISTSEDNSGLRQVNSKEYYYKELIDSKSKQSFLFIPQNTNDKKIMNIFNTWKDNLESLSLRISTGPVVAFRQKEYLQEQISPSNKDYVPLLWLNNIKPMEVEFPENRNKRQYQYIKYCKSTINVLLPNENYILIRRFSTKDDKNRLVAAPYCSSYFSYKKIGIENHLNYITSYKGVMNESHVFGLSALLNSSLFDRYFRIFNGNTQVSATELKNIPLPPIEKIEMIGKELINYIGNSIFIDKEKIDNTIKKNLILKELK